MFLNKSIMQINNFSNLYMIHVKNLEMNFFKTASSANIESTFPSNISWLPPGAWNVVFLIQFFI